jgi:signal transduction histidine kinase
MVFMSDRMARMLSAPDNFILSLDFVRLMRKPFGSFLNVAAEKLTAVNPYRKEYSSTIVVLGELFTLKLILDCDRELYTLTVEGHKKEDASVRSPELAEILDMLPVYIWQQDRDMKITYCNKQYASAVEAKPEYVITNNVELIPKGRTPHISSERLTANPRKFSEHVIINGERRLLNITVTPSNESKTLVGLAVDCTEHEALQKEHINYKKQTEEILDNISVPIAIFDRDVVLIFANSAMLKLFHTDGLDLTATCKLSDIINHLITNELVVIDMNLKDYQEKVMNLISTLIEPYHTSINIYGGKIMGVTISPVIGGGLIFVFEDVSEVISLERKINSLTSIYTEMASGLAEGVLIFGDDNRVRLTNKSLCEILHAGEVNAIGMHIREFFEACPNALGPPDVIEDFFMILIGAASQRSKVSNLLVLANGKTVMYSYSPLPENLNLLTFTDITDSLNISDAVAEKNQIIAQLGNLKETLVTKIAYEFKTPLSSISGFVDVLYNQYFGSLSEKQLRYCRELRDITANLAGTVDTIISLVNIEDGSVRLKFEEANLLTLLQKVMKCLETRAEENGIEIIANLEEADVVVIADQQTMEDAITQLISRAIRVTPRNGEISVSVENSKLHEGWIDIVLDDAGISVSGEDVESYTKIMSNSGSSSIVGYGSTLEIVLAREIAELHKGSVSVDTNDHNGTRVILSIPVKQFLQ